MTVENIIAIVFVIIGCLSLIRIIYLSKVTRPEKIESISKESNELETPEIRLTIKSIIRWEQLNNKPFSSLDYDSEDDIISLFYVCRIADEVSWSLDEFKEKLNKEHISKMVEDFERKTYLMAQFQRKKEESKTEKSNKTESDPAYIKDLVSILIMSGMDAHFALNEMELCDLSLFLDAYDRKVKDRLESSRLWTYILISPHLSKKTKSPRDLYPFIWELPEIEKESEEAQTESKEVLKSFLKHGLN